MTKEQRLKKRYRAEKRFKMYGLISVSLAVIFVLILVQNIFSKGSSAFSRTMIEVAVNYDSSLLELEGPINQNSLKDADGSTGELGISTTKATIPIRIKGAVSPKA